MASELAYVHDSIALAERDMAFIADWIRTHPGDDHVADYRRLLAVDEGMLRRARKRGAALERRLTRIEGRAQGSGPVGRTILSRLRLGRRGVPPEPPRSAESR